MKSIVKILVLLAFVLFATSKPLIAQQSKEQAFDKIIEKYGNLKSISVHFKMPENPGITGHLKAKTGNKYIMQIAGRIIICNGSTIWNYSREENSVVVSNFEDSAGEMSIEDFFFSFIKIAKPSSLAKEISSGGLNGMSLKLVPDKKKKGDLVNDVKITYEPNSFKLLGITANTTAGTHFWQIESFKSNPKLSDSMFEFKEPKDVKIIDLR